jgi:hypothetical protein
MAAYRRPRRYLDIERNSNFYLAEQELALTIATGSSLSENRFEVS